MQEELWIPSAFWRSRHSAALKTHFRLVRNFFFFTLLLLFNYSSCDRFLTRSARLLLVCSLRQFFFLHLPFSKLFCMRSSTRWGKNARLSDLLFFFMRQFSDSIWFPLAYFSGWSAVKQSKPGHRTLIISTSKTLRLVVRHPKGLISLPLSLSFDFLLFSTLHFQHTKSSFSSFS